MDRITLSAKRLIHHLILLLLFDLVVGVAVSWLVGAFECRCCITSFRDIIRARMNINEPGIESSTPLYILCK